MADDIDDLLDEVEDKFVKKSKPEKKSTLPKVRPTRRRPEDDEMDKLIEDICGENEPEIECNSVTKVPGKTSQSRPAVTKCFPLCIGGSSVSKGHGNSVNKRSCDMLRCTSCDFKVASFDDFDWDSSTDYLFLRNNAPDFERLKSNLSRRKGYRAYCCQCSHIAVNTLTDVKHLQVKWVCGQH
ncbi:cilia- and flagella-associated protein 418-like [Ruditapes philippinarum]|uniref:cilia- and flagella-associated protein 418-like n=1 Tax=Ruditapes philippinarum TaxID=129788 RepID=UPI00295B4660|nr:cilia- and flagella-associated protein 418-like [Ruditapes philippinarum]